MGGIRGVFGGEYKKRLDERQQKVDSLRADNEAMNSRLEQNQADRAQIATQERMLLRQLEQLNASLARSQKLLSDTNAAKQLDRDTLSSLRDKQQRLESTMRELSAMSTQFGPIDLLRPGPNTARVETEEERREHQQKLETKTRKLQQDIDDHNALIDRLFKRSAD